MAATGRLKWRMLALGMSAHAAGCMFLYGLPFLIPALRAETGLGLAAVGLLVSCPSIGMLLALVGWGAITDRYGERRVMAGGLVASAVLLVAAAGTRHPVPLGVLLVMAGAAGASVSAASGRVVLGWFPPERRGVAMGFRQAAQPLSLALAGLLLPALPGVPAALLALAGICLVTGVAVGALLADPPRASAGQRRGSPYRQPALWRVHAASALLVIPQFVIGAFALEYLVTRQHFTPSGAGRLLAVAGLAGAASRLVAGRWSDRLASRLRPMRWLALGNAVLLGLLALVAGGPVGIGLVLVAVVGTVSWNGLAFTAVAELAGNAWAGRAFGVQNTLQNLTAAGTPAVWGALIAAYGFGPGFGLAALVPLVAVAVTPRD